MRFFTPFFCAALLLATPAGADDALARRLINSQGCKACHRIEGTGAAFAPDLRQAGRRLSAEQVRARLVNPEHLHAGGQLADFSHLSAAEIDALVEFLGQRR